MPCTRIVAGSTTDLSSTPILAVQDGCSAVSASARTQSRISSSVLDRRPGRQLAVVVRRERRLVEDVARDPDRLDPLAAVGGRGQVVELHRGVLPRVARPDPHPAAGVGVHRADVDLVAVALGRRRAVVPDRDRQEVEHQVGVVDVLVAAGEAAALEVVGGAEPGAVDQPVVADPRPRAPAQPGRDRDREPARRTGCRPRGGPGGSRPTPGRWWTTSMPCRPRSACVAHARELEQLGGVDRSAAEDHLAGADAAVEPATAQVVDARPRAGRRTGRR